LHNTRVRRNPSGFLQVAVSKTRKHTVSSAHLAYSRFRYSAKTYACENLEEFQVLLGHTSVQTTERYVGLNSKFVMP
jgi:integrase